MKQSPNMQKLEQMLRSSVLVVGGFMGGDSRPVTEVIDEDAATLAHLDVTAEQVAARMQEITDAAIKGLGNWVVVDAGHEAMVEEARGAIFCPWSDGQRFRKRVTLVKLAPSGRQVQWSDLNIHLIGKHTFFEGKGSYFRTEPEELVKALF
ncbi:MAG: hypothetical protein ACYTAS_01645 [Planctomycetota bacterium]|jgi:hypothetical protein